MARNSVITKTERFFNMLELIGVVVMLFMAFAFEVFLHELPCPLCLLQRVGFLCVAFGFLLNLRFGLRPSHYSISLVSALFTSLIALRQIALHVVPGTAAYGEAYLGLHLYTWSFIISLIIVIVTTLMLGIDRQYQKVKIIPLRWYLHVLFGAVLLLIITNIFTVVMQCGFVECPDNPTSYLFTFPFRGL